MSDAASTRSPPVDRPPDDPLGRAGDAPASPLGDLLRRRAATRWSPTWSPRCTPPKASAWPPARSASTSRSSSSTARTRTVRRTGASCATRVLLLPEGKDRRLDEGEEGCLSYPGAFVACARPDMARVTGQGLDGEPVEFAGTGLLARCLQHETDHTLGMVFGDRLSTRLRKKLRKQMEAAAEEFPRSGRRRPRLSSTASRPRVPATEQARRLRVAELRAERAIRETRYRRAGHVAGDRGRRGDVERVDPRGHRDHRPPVRRDRPSAARDRGPPSRGPAPAGRSRRRPARSATASSARVSATVVNPARTAPAGRRTSPAGGSTAREHRPHRHLDRPPVERVRAARREQHRVESSAAPERKHAPTLVWSTMSSRTSTDRAPATHLLDACGSGRRCSDASAPRWTWKPVTSSAKASRPRSTGRRDRASTSASPVEPARRHQERARRESGLHRPADDLLALRQEQPVLGLEVLRAAGRRAGRGSRPGAGRPDRHATVDRRLTLGHPRCGERVRDGPPRRPRPRR